MHDLENREKRPSLYKLVWLFALGCVLGFLLESAFCYVTKGYVESRRGMVWGPFNQVYGFGLVAMVLVLSPVSTRKKGFLFLYSAIVGGVFEFLCSWLQERVLGTVSWDYTSDPLSISGRTSLGFMLCWGILGLMLMCWVYPYVSRWIDRIPKRFGVVAARCMAGFLALNMLTSLAAVSRWIDRQGGETAPSNAVEAYLDETFPDDRLASIYPNMKMR